jgi:hypothetical protein
MTISEFVHSVPDYVSLMTNLGLYMLAFNPRVRTFLWSYSVRRRFSTPRVTPIYNDYYRTKTNTVQVKVV